MNGVITVDIILRRMPAALQIRAPAIKQTMAYIRLRGEEYSACLNGRHTF